MVRPAVQRTDQLRSNRGHELSPPLTPSSPPPPRRACGLLCRSSSSSGESLTKRACTCSSTASPPSSSRVRAACSSLSAGWPTPQTPTHSAAPRRCGSCDMPTPANSGRRRTSTLTRGPSPVSARTSVSCLHYMSRRDWCERSSSPQVIAEPSIRLLLMLHLCSSVSPPQPLLLSPRCRSLPFSDHPSSAHPSSPHHRHSARLLHRRRLARASHPL